MKRNVDEKEKKENLHQSTVIWNEGKIKALKSQNHFGKETLLRIKLIEATSYSLDDTKM